MLDELLLAGVVDVRRVAARHKARRLVILENISAKLVRSRARYEGYLRAAAATEFRRKAARNDLKFLNRIGVRTKRGKVRAARARFVDVDSVERKIKRTVARTVD